MITKQGILWECVCGFSEYSNSSPEECLKCGKLDSFEQVPEELLEERERDLPEELEWD